MTKLIVSILFISFISSCMSRNKDAADMVLHNAQVYTVNKTQVNAEAIAVKDGKIVFAGSNEDVKKLIDNKTEVIDCKGQFVMPGFI